MSGLEFGALYLPVTGPLYLSSLIPFVLVTVYSREDRASGTMDNYKVTDLFDKLEVRTQIGGQQMVVENCKVGK